MGAETEGRAVWLPGWHPRRDILSHMLCSDAVISVVRQDVGRLSRECAAVWGGGGASGRGGPFMLLPRKARLREAKEAEPREAQRSSWLPPGPVAANQVVIWKCSEGSEERLHLLDGHGKGRAPEGPSALAFGVSRKPHQSAGLHVATSFFLSILVSGSLLGSSPRLTSTLSYFTLSLPQNRP